MEASRVLIPDPALEKSRLLRTLAALAFAKRLLARRGRLAPQDAATMRGAGYTDREIEEIAARVRAKLPTL